MASEKAAAASLTGTDDPIAYWIEVRSGSYPVREVQGVEGLGRPFRFEGRIVTDDGVYFDPLGTAGDYAILHLQRDGIEVRAIHGVLAEGAVEASVTGAPELTFVIEPKLAMLRYMHDARVYVDRTVPEIVSHVLEHGSVPHEMRLAGTYAKRPYTVQYQESDFDFVSRLLEDEGIFYQFAEDEKGTVVFNDDSSAYEPLPGDATLPFRPASGIARDEAAIFEIGKRAALGPSKVTLRDFSVDRPSATLEVTAPGVSQFGLEHYDFPGKYTVVVDGERKAKLIAQAMAVSASAVIGASDQVTLAPGRTFFLVDAPEGISEGGYSVTLLSHVWKKGEPMELAFEALPETVTYRPPRKTPTPVITGTLSGFVTGPEGADIHTDELGRVKVLFPWDRHSAKDDTASHWIPVLQDNTGHSIAIPRIGWEVVVAFVEGDPDRPVILGRVYNGADPFPEVLPANKTVSALQSLTSPGRGGANAIRMEDRAGSEQIYVQAEKDQNVVVENDKGEKILHNETVSIGDDEDIVVGRRQTVIVGKSRQENVIGNQSTTVGASRSRNVALAEKASVTGNASLAVGGAHIRRIDAYDAVRTTSLTEKVGGVDLEVSLKKNNTNAGMAMTTTVGGAMVELAARTITEKSLTFHKETVGLAVKTKAGQEVSIHTDTNRTVSIGGALSVEAMSIALTGTAGVTGTVGTGDIKGLTKLTLTVGGSSVTLKGSDIIVNTGGDIEITASANGNLATGNKAKLNEG